MLKLPVSLMGSTGQTTEQTAQTTNERYHYHIGFYDIKSPGPQQKVLTHLEHPTPHMSRGGWRTVRPFGRSARPASSMLLARHKVLESPWRFAIRE